MTTAATLSGSLYAAYRTAYSALKPAEIDAGELAPPGDSEFRAIEGEETVSDRDETY